MALNGKGVLVLPNLPLASYLPCFPNTPSTPSQHPHEHYLEPPHDPQRYRSDHHRKHDSPPKDLESGYLRKEGRPLHLKDLPLKLQSDGKVLVKTIACGVCYFYAGALAGAFGNGFPIVPGQEVIGNIVAVGDGEKRWEVEN